MMSFDIAKAKVLADLLLILGYSCWMVIHALHLRGSG